MSPMGLGDIDSKSQPSLEKTAMKDDPVKLHILTGEDLTNESWAWRIGTIGPAGTGKTDFSLSVLNDLIYEQNLSPEACLLCFIDLDGGVAPLLRKNVIPPELKSRLRYTMCSTFREVELATDTFFKSLEAHREKHGNKGCWIVVDNMQKAWEMSRDQYAMNVYGFSMRELMEIKRKEALAAGKKTLPTFNMEFDYQIINPYHNDWAQSFNQSGFNYVWLSPISQELVTDKNGNVKEVIERWGQKANPQRVDYILRKYIEGQTFLGDVMKSRTTSLYPNRIANPNFTNVRRELERVEKMEQEQKKRKRAEKPVVLKGNEIEKKTSDSNEGLPVTLDVKESSSTEQSSDVSEW